LKRSFPFILLNILVSAATTLVVLLIWDNTHNTHQTETTPAVYPTQAISLVECTGTIPDKGSKVITITNIIGSGDLQKEEIDLHYSGSKEFCLNGWKITAAGNQEFTFPAFFQLYTQDVNVKIFSRSGANSPLELYWGLSEPIWKSGDTARLIDPKGNEIATYQIP